MRWLRSPLPLISLAILALAACETPYKPASTSGWGSPYGYLDKDLGFGDYRIRAMGTPNTPAAHVTEIAMRRAAEITLAAGATHFEVRTSRAFGVHRTSQIFVPMAVGKGVAQVPIEAAETVDPVRVLLIRIVPAGRPIPRGAIDARVMAGRPG